MSEQEEKLKAARKAEYKARSTFSPADWRVAAQAWRDVEAEAQAEYCEDWAARLEKEDEC